MKPADQLAEFVGQALSQGKARDEIAAVLDQAGWSQGETARAMAAWADSSFSPPVPRPRDTVSARDAFGYLVLFTALAFSVWHINSLGFALIDRLYLTDQTATYIRAYSLESLRWSIAVLVVSVPLFLWLNRRLGLAMQADPARQRSALRKWFGYMTLFLAALGLAGDAVATIYALLSGDLTLQFTLKAALVLLTAGLVFAYYRIETGAANAS